MKLEELEKLREDTEAELIAKIIERNRCAAGGSSPDKEGPPVSDKHAETSTRRQQLNQEIDALSGKMLRVLEAIVAKKHPAN